MLAVISLESVQCRGTDKQSRVKWRSMKSFRSFFVYDERAPYMWPNLPDDPVFTGILLAA